VIAVLPPQLGRPAILDKKSWDIMGYYGRQWNDPTPAPLARAPVHRTVRTSLTAIKLKDLLPWPWFQRAKGVQRRPAAMQIARPSSATIIKEQEFLLRNKNFPKWLI
jgi:hypothetical protein